MDYSAAYIIRCAFNAVVVSALIVWALVLLWVLYMLLMNLLAFLLPRCFPKTAKQRRKTALAQSLINQQSHRHWKTAKRPMTRRELSRKAWIIREQLRKETLHPNKPIDRDFFKKGKKS